MTTVTIRNAHLLEGRSLNQLQEAIGLLTHMQQVMKNIVLPGELILDWQELFQALRMLSPGRRRQLRALGGQPLALDGNAAGVGDADLAAQYEATLIYETRQEHAANHRAPVEAAKQPTTAATFQAVASGVSWDESQRRAENSPKADQAPNT